MILSIGAGLCRPFAYDWDNSIPGGKCSELDRTYISIAALDILGDAMIIDLFVQTGLTNSSRFGAKPSGALVSRPRWAPGRASALEKLPIPMRYRPGVSS